jgi:hypothetical protein
MLGLDSVDSVAHVIQVALTPVFLLSGIASLLAVLSTRLARVADRVDALAEQRNEGGRPAKTGSAEEPVSTLADLGVDKKLSSRAQRLAELPEEQFEARVAEVKEGAARALEMTERERQDEKRQRREQREADLAQRQFTLPDKAYGVIYADPPWRFEPYSRETGMDRAADNHYPTLPLEIIKTMTPILAAEDCALFLWATVPMLPEALDVMRERIHLSVAFHLDQEPYGKRLLESQLP